MTYAEVLIRLIDLMYVNHQRRWISESYSLLVYDFAYRTAERMPTAPDIVPSMVEDPCCPLKAFLGEYPDARSQQLHPEDVSYFLTRCKARHQKPVNFVPARDDDFEYWFKKDSLWQSEDIDAVVDQDAGRVCVLHGPVSAQCSLDENATAKGILDSICAAHADMVQRDYYAKSEVPSATEKCFYDRGRSSDPVDTEAITTARTALSQTVTEQTYGQEKISRGWGNSLSDWIGAILSEDFVLQGNTRVTNPLRRLFDQCGMSVQTENETLTVELVKFGNDQQQTLARVSSSKDTEISVDLYQSSSHYGLEPVNLPFKFRYDSKRIPHNLIEIMEGRNERIKFFYSRLWLHQDPDPSKRADSTFQSEEMTLSRAMLEDIVSTVETAHSSEGMTNLACDIFPIDVCVIIAWDVLMKPLLVKDIDVDLLQLVHRSNTSEYVSDFPPLRVGERVSARSHVQAIAIENTSKSIVVKS